MSLKFDSCFELAFRRALFAFILLLGYLATGTVLLYVLIRADFSSNDENRMPEYEVLDRLDFARNELLNVFWAEALASRTESDWMSLANNKMDAYEKHLISSNTKLFFTANGKRKNDSVMELFKSSFLLVTTIGGGKFSNAVSELGPFTKIFVIFYSTIGIPLMLIYLGQCVKAIKSLVIKNGGGEWVGALMFSIGALFITGIAMDITENSHTDTSMLDALFSAFLVLSTIGGDRAQVENFSLPLLFASCLLLLGVFSFAFATIQRQIERRIGRYEFAFSCSVGKFERVVTETRMLRSVTEVDEPTEEKEDDAAALNNDFSNKLNESSRESIKDKTDGLVSE